MRSKARCSSWCPSSPGGRTASRARDTSWGQPPWASSERRLPAAQRRCCVRGAWVHAAKCLAWASTPSLPAHLVVNLWPPTPDCLPARFPPPASPCGAATTCHWASCAASSWQPCPGPPSASPTSWAAPARRMCASPSSSSEYSVPAECRCAAAWMPSACCPALLCMMFLATYAAPGC